MGDYTSNLFFFKPPIGARGLEQKRLFDLSLDKVDDRLGKEIWVGDPQFVWHTDPFERLKNAVFGIDTTITILRIPPEIYVISESYSIPDNITVVLERGAILHQDTGISLTLYGGVAAGPYQIFAGQGTVVFGRPVEIFSEWWGLPGWSSPEGNVTAPLGSRYVKTAGTPPLYYIKNGSTGNTGWEAIGADGGGGTGVYNFTELYDAPDSYTGQSGKVVRVNASANALEFGNADHSHANQTNLDAINQHLAATSSPTFAGMNVNGNLAVSGTVDGVDVANHHSRHEAGGPDVLAHQSLSGAGSQTHTQLDAHLASTSNPHGVTAAQAGALADLADTVKDSHIDWGTGSGQVSADDIPDGATKIIPTAAQENSWDGHLSNTANPHSVTPAQVGLGNVSNDAQVKKAASSVDGNLVIWVGSAGDAVMDAGARPGDFAAAAHHHDAIYAPLAQGVTNGNAHSHAGGDGAQIDHASLANPGSQTHAQLDAHLASTANPHGVSAAQVGLGNVTNDAQLKRAAGDLNAFPEKTSPASDDVLLLEDSAEGYAKKKVRIANLPTGSGGAAFNPGGLSDDSYQGDTFSGIAGESLAQWDFVFLKSDGKWWKARADTTATCPAQGVAVAAADADAPVTILFRGFFRDDGGVALTVGGLIYLSPATAGEITSTLPSTTGNQVQILGYALTDKIRIVNPNLILIEVP